MSAAEWTLILVIYFTALAFLTVGIVLMLKFISLAEEIKKIILTGQNIAEKTDDIVDNVKNFAAVGGLVKVLANRFTSETKKGGSNDKKTH